MSGSLQNNQLMNFIVFSIIIKTLAYFNFGWWMLGKEIDRFCVYITLLCIIHVQLSANNKVHNYVVFLKSQWLNSQMSIYATKLLYYWFYNHFFFCTFVRYRLYILNKYSTILLCFIWSFWWFSL